MRAYVRNFTGLRNSARVLHSQENGNMTRRAVTATITALIAVSTAASAQQPNPATATATTQPGSKPAPRTITLEQAVQLALGNSKALRIAVEGVNRARGIVHERGAAQKPVVNLDATFTHLDQ